MWSSDGQTLRRTEVRKDVIIWQMNIQGKTKARLLITEHWERRYDNQQVNIQEENKHKIRFYDTIQLINTQWRGGGGGGGYGVMVIVPYNIRDDCLCVVYLL